MAHTDSINQIKIFPNSNMAASASDDNTVKVWDLTSTRLIQTYTGHTNNVECVEFLDANNIASGSVDNTIQIWQITSGTTKKTIKFSSWVTSLLLLPNGLLMSGDFTGSIKAWNATSGTMSYSLANSHKAAVNAMIVVNGTEIASGSDDYKGLK